jgi:hypothetical protein
MKYETDDRLEYYTPEQTEFHVGFIYQTLDYTDEFNEVWLEHRFPEPYICTLKDNQPDLVELFYSKLNDSRVQYLNREDILELGFEYDESILLDFYINDQVFVKPDVYGYMIWKTKLSHDYDRKWLKLEALFEDGEWSVLFEGKIKNKSELIKLLNQLGLNNEDT